VTEIWTMGELLAEFMRPQSGLPLGDVGSFSGPYPSGAPGIFVDTVARLGHSGGIVSGIGDDAFGEAIMERLARDGVRTDQVEIVADHATGVAFIAYGNDADRSYLFHWDGTPAVMAAVPPREIAIGARFFHVMGCSLMPNAAFAERIIETAGQFADAGARISLDPNIRAELLADSDVMDVLEPILRRTSILLPSESELLLLGGEDTNDASVATLMRRYPLEIVVVKLGALGSAVYSGGRRIDVPSFDVVEVDPTGAGDCFDVVGLDLAVAALQEVVRADEDASLLGLAPVSSEGPIHEARALCGLEEREPHLALDESVQPRAGQPLLTLPMGRVDTELLHHQDTGGVGPSVGPQTSAWGSGCTGRMATLSARCQVLPSNSCTVMNTSPLSGGPMNVSWGWWKSRQP
jgi:sugar/nucleoside kinase (ribokinase family)